MATRCPFTCKMFSSASICKFVKTISACIDEGLHSINNEEKRKVVGFRLRHPVRKIARCTHKKMLNSINIKGAIRNLVCTLKYFQFNAFVEKYFTMEGKIQKLITNAEERRPFDIEDLFIQYYQQCIISLGILKLFQDFDHYYTTKIQNHIQTGIYFVPCISLFKEYHDWTENSHIMSEESWLSLVFQYLGMCNSDYEGRLHDMYRSFREKYVTENDLASHSDFFCTVLIPILDDLEFIDCLRNNYDFLVLIIHMIASIIGKPGLIGRMLKHASLHDDRSKYLKTFKILKQNPLQLECYELISLKPQSNNCLFPQPTKLLIANTPFFYRYDPKNFPHTGIMSQLFLFASGTENEFITDIDTFVLSAKDILCRLPPEWRNLYVTYEKISNFIRKERKRAPYEDKSPSTFNTSIADEYFSVLPNDAYMVLYYISRVLSYYLQIPHFESENHLFELYDAILAERLESPVDDVLEAAEQVIVKLGVRLKVAKCIPDFYNTPEYKNVCFDYFSKVTTSKVTQVPFYRLTKMDTNDKSLVQCGMYPIMMQKSSMDKSAIRLILFLSTVLNIKRAVKVKPVLKFTTEQSENYSSFLSGIKFVDRNFFDHLMYRTEPTEKGYMVLHNILKSSKRLPILHLGMGLLRLLCLMKRPKKPNLLLLELLPKLYSSYAKANTDIPLHLMINQMYFAFKNLGKIGLFYPLLMAVSFAYGGTSVLKTMKELVKKSFDCSENLIKPLSRQSLIEWNALFLATKATVFQQEVTLENAGKVNIFYHLENVMSGLLIEEESINLRLCDLLYFIIHLHFPLKFSNYGVPLPNSKDGFEFYLLHTDI